MSSNQRTKGNVKPSNSERASRLLSTNQLLSFSQASKTLSSIYNSNPAEQSKNVSAFDCDIDFEFQTIFKHMAKKDNNTKTKALQDFVSLCKTKDKAELLKISRYWFRIYRKLANAIEWNVRQLAHEAQYQFISSFDRNTMVPLFQSTSSLANNDFSEKSSSDVSFQTLVTMPAIMWTSCYDAYSQPNEMAKKIFKHLYPDDKSVEFLLSNYESILNYCLYTIFNKIPINLFYNTALPADSVKMFEEHLLIVCFQGLSSLINELLCYYLRFAEKSTSTLANNSEQLKCVFDCLEKIFLLLNSEFVKCKGLDETATTKEPSKPEKEAIDTTELELSKKEKKKLKKELTQGKKDKGPKKNCEMWSCSTSKNTVVRMALFQTLNSITKLTTFFSDPLSQGKMSYFEKLNVSTRLWFKLYKSNFFDLVFKHFIDPAPEIRGLAWLLGSHLLANQPIYQPWSVVNCDQWLNSVLKLFILNGMKTPGSIIDFGLARIGLEQYQPLYGEFFDSKLQIFDVESVISFKLENKAAKSNVKLIAIFIDSFNTSAKSKYEIYRLFLDNLFVAIDNVVLLTDLNFLLELYFNICHLAVHECLEINAESVDDDTNKMLNTITKQIHDLLKKCLSGVCGKNDSFTKSQIFFYNLLFVHYLSQIPEDLRRSFSPYNLKLVEDRYQFFETRLTSLYTNLLLPDVFKCLDFSHLDPKILAVARFLTESFYQCDGYFSYDYYFTPRSLDYQKNMMKIVKQNLGESNVCDTSKQVSFGKPGDLSEKKLREENSGPCLFDYCLENKEYDRTWDSGMTLSLQNALSTFVEDFNMTVVELTKFINSIFMKHLSSSLNQNFDQTFQNMFLLLSHLQFILRSVSKENLLKIDAFLSAQNSLGMHLINWIQKIQDLCEDLPKDSPEVLMKKYRHLVIIGVKIIDIYLVTIPKFDDFATCFQTEFLQNLNPFAYCLVIRQLSKLKKMPMTESQQKVVKDANHLLREFMIGDFERYRSLMFRQISVVFGTAQNKDFQSKILFELINLNAKTAVEISDTAFRTIPELLNSLCDSFSKIDNLQLARHNFYYNFPMLLANLYEILLNRFNKLFLVSHFEDDFIRHHRLLLQRVLDLLLFHPSDQSIEMNAELFIKNCMHFFMHCLTKMFANYSYYQPLITKVSKELFNFMAEKIIIRRFDKSFKFPLAVSIVQNLLNSLIFKHKPLMTSEETDSSDIQASLDQIIAIPSKLEQELEPFCSNFENEHDVSHLHNLYYEEDFIIQTYEFIYLDNSRLLNAENYQTKLNLAWKNIVANMEFLEMNTFIAIILEALLKNDLDCHYSSVLEQDFVTISETDEDVGLSFFRVLKKLLKNFYYLENFSLMLKNYDFTKLFLTHKKKKPVANPSIDIAEYETCIKRFKDNFKPMETMCKSIICLAAEKFRLNRSDVLLDFITFLNQSTKSDGFNLPFINCFLQFYLENENFAWPEFSTLKNEFSFQDDLCWISMNYTRNLDLVLECIHRVVEPFTVVEMTENEAIFKRFESFASRKHEDLKKFLVTLNISLYKLEQLSCHANMEKLETAVRDTMKLLFKSDFPLLFKGAKRLPKILEPNYQIYWFTTHYLAQSVRAMNDFQLEDFRFFTTIFREWIQLIFTLPEGENLSIDSIFLGSKIIISFREFLQAAKAWMVQNQTTQPVIVECLRNFFAYHSQNMLLPLFVVMNDSLNDNPIHARLLQQLAGVVCGIDAECLRDIAILELNQTLLVSSSDHVLKKRLRMLQEQSDLDQTNNKYGFLQPTNRYYDFILENVTPLMLKDDYDIIFCSYHLISNTVHCAEWRTGNQSNSSSMNQSTSETPTSDENPLTLSQLDSNDQEKPPAAPPKILVCLLENLFKCIPIEDLDPQASYAYLLVWTIYLRLLARFPYKGTNGEIRADLINFILEKNLHLQLFENLFLLMHDSIDDELDDEYFEAVISSIMKGQSTKDVMSKLDCLEDSRQLQTLIGNDQKRNARLAVFVYYQALCYMPNVLRSWFNTLKHTQKATVDNVTRKHFTKLLIERELDTITEADRTQLGNIILKFSKKSNEITAVYSLKEISFGIKFDFKANYPLTPVTISCFNKSGVNDDLYRKWLQRLTIFFNKMNCSIVDGIIMIKSNMDKFFEGIEECMICLFVLYGVTGQLPRFKCPQCKKKFHISCIRKWFQMHHSATCPQCKFEFQ